MAPSGIDISSPVTPAAAVSGGHGIAQSLSGLDFYALLEQFDQLKYALLAQHQQEMKALADSTTRLSKVSTNRGATSGRDGDASSRGAVSEVSPKVGQPLGSQPISVVGEESNMIATMTAGSANTGKEQGLSIYESRNYAIASALSEDWSVSDLDSDNDNLAADVGPLAQLQDCSKVGKLMSLGTSSGKSLSHAIGARRNSLRSDGVDVHKTKSRFQARESWKVLKEALKDVSPEDDFAEAERTHMNNKGSTSRRMSDAYLMLPSVMVRMMSRLVISTNSKRGLLWNMLRVCVVLYDVVNVPLVTFLPVEILSSALELGLCIFWTFDILASMIMATFVDGVEVRNPMQLLKRYVRVWATFDLILLALQWIEWTLLNSVDANKDLTRVLYSLRFFRLLRIVKAKDKILSLTLVFLPQGFALIDIAPFILLLPFCLHLLACIWYALGDHQDGWVRNPEHESKSAANMYLISVHWVAMMVHGTVSVFPTTVGEYVFAIVLSLLTVALLAWVTGQIVQVIATTSNLEHSRASEYCRRYVKSRRVSTELTVRLNQFFQAQKRRGFNESLEETRQLFDALPELLQKALAQEVRGPLLNAHPYFQQLKGVPGGLNAFRTLCHEAVGVLWAVTMERIYTAGEICETMFFVETGSFIYSEADGQNQSAQMGTAQLVAFDKDFHRMTSPGSLASQSHMTGGFGRPNGSSQPVTGFIHTHKSGSQERQGVPMEPKNTLSTDPSCCNVLMLRGNWLCEPALWTKWRNKGNLAATAEGGSVITVLESEFLKVLARQDGAGTYTVAYLKHFMWHLNHTPKQALSDLLRFDISIDDIVNMSGGHRPDEHLVFLSHFKQEAGTEAALIQESLERMIRGDITHPAAEFFSPIFLDSEDLNDLRTLASHVRKSHNMIVLLTDHVLFRPWCILEMVIAMRNGVNLHPVEIHRPGLSFTYPTEETYVMIRSGAIFTPEDLMFIRNEGIELFEVEEAIRELFHRISMSFSPHKSIKIRQTELQDMLARCVLGQSKTGNDGATMTTGVSHV